MKVKPKFTYTKYQPEYKAQVISLLSQLWDFDEDEKLAYFKWKYEDNPYTEEPLAFVALDGDKVVAFRGYMTLPMKGGPHSFLNAALSDTVTDKNYRRMGLFKGITDYSLKEIAKNPEYWISTNSSSGGPTLNGYLSLGWFASAPRKNIFNISLLGIAGKIIKRNFKYEKEITIKRKNNSITITDFIKPDEVSKLIEFADNHFCIDYSPKLLKWRYNNPHNNFIFGYLYKDDNQLSAFVAMANIGKGRYDIVDFYGKSDKELGILIRAMKKTLRPLYFLLWTVGESNQIIKRPRYFGFISLDVILNRIKKFKKPPFLLRLFGDNIKVSQTELMKNGNWSWKKIVADEI